MRKIFLSFLVFLIFISGCVSPQKRGISTVRKNIVSDAKKYLGVKYRYGGTDPSGFDCSGFVQYIYKKNGIIIPRTVSEMEIAGKRVKDPKIGDIVTFDDPLHVGILIGNNKFIHASTLKGVTIDKISEKWYKNKIRGYFTFFF
ncbi:MAG: C40 family peptidase [candidate division WOR-3 bacterium]